MTSTQTIEKRPHVVGIGGTLRDGSNGLRALERALAAAEEAGATTELLDLRELDLPMYEPGRPLEGFGESAEEGAGGEYEKARAECPPQAKEVRDAPVEGDADGVDEEVAGDDPPDLPL